MIIFGRRQRTAVAELYICLFLDFIFINIKMIIGNFHHKINIPTHPRSTPSENNSPLICPEHSEPILDSSAENFNKKLQNEKNKNKYDLFFISYGSYQQEELSQNRKQEKLQKNGQNENSNKSLQVQEEPQNNERVKLQNFKSQILKEEYNQQKDMEKYSALHQKIKPSKKKVVIEIDPESELNQNSSQQRKIEIAFLKKLFQEPQSQKSQADLQSAVQDQHSKSSNSVSELQEISSLSSQSSLSSLQTDLSQDLSDFLSTSQDRMVQTHKTETENQESLAQPIDSYTQKEQQDQLKKFQAILNEGRNRQREQEDQNYQLSQSEESKHSTNSILRVKPSQSPDCRYLKQKSSSISSIFDYQQQQLERELSSLDIQEEESNFQSSRSSRSALQSYITKLQNAEFQQQLQRKQLMQIKSKFRKASQILESANKKIYRKHMKIQQKQKQQQTKKFPIEEQSQEQIHFKDQRLKMMATFSGIIFNALNQMSSTFK